MGDEKKCKGCWALYAELSEKTRGVHELNQQEDPEEITPARMMTLAEELAELARRAKTFDEFLADCESRLPCASPYVGAEIPLARSLVRVGYRKLGGWNAEKELTEIVEKASQGLFGMPLREIVAV